MQLFQRALAANLHEETTWHQLLHYRESSRASSGIESQVDDSRYFLASDGKINPRSELLASIKSLVTSSDLSVDDNHPRCRFVSREKWLREKLSLPMAQVPEECALYRNWRAEVGSHSMSLVFPASYLNSPSSMFGHTLLRIDPENIDQGSEWLSWSLNFAAETGDENFSAGYAFKGIAGGYAGKFSSVPYFKKLQEYGAIENRDIWEYQLDFTPEELDRMLDHSWELRDINFDYYFFLQNCSYRLLELMDYARPGLNLTDQFRVTTIPADTVKAVVAAGIVEKTHYRPSLGTGIQARYQALPKKLKHWVTDISDNPDITQSTEFKTIDVALQSRLIRGANDLLTYRSRRTARSPAVAERRLKLLKLISELPVEISSIGQPSAPEQAHDTRTVSFGGGMENEVNFSQIGIRWSYHDLLDRTSGYLKGAGIVLGDLKLRRYSQSDLQIQSLNLVTLQSISDRALIFNTLSWNLSAGFERDATRLNNRLSGKAVGSIGKSTEVFKNGIGYALLGASVTQFNRLKENYVDVQAQLGIIHHYRNAVLQVELELKSAQDNAPRLSALLNYNIPLAKNHAIRMSYARSKSDDQFNTSANLNYRFYF